MGWKGYTDTRERIFGEVADQVIRHAPCDLMLLKIAEESQFRRCLFPTAGGPHAQLAAEFLNVLGKAFEMEVTASYVVPPGASEEQRSEAERWIEKTLDEQKRLGATFCFPHQVTTDSLVDRCTREIRHMAHAVRMIREHGMIPGLGTHMPETIIFADESGLDVESYISLYNSMGFLMQLEVDWISRIIHDAKKPVMTTKPLAGGQLRPFQGLHFVWNTIRDQDMVTVGTMTPREAEECVEMSLSILEGRRSQIELQETRSKGTVKA